MGGKKLTKLKSVLKKWNSFGRHSIRSSSDEDDHESSYIDLSSSSAASRDLRLVYVGKSRRQYLVSPDVADHPLFRELVARSGYDNDGAAAAVSVSCEVILFEHLLWLLQDGIEQRDSFREIADFYTC